MMVKCSLPGNSNGDLLTIVTMTTADEALAQNASRRRLSVSGQMNSLEERTMWKMTRHHIPLLQRQALMLRLETYRIECGGYLSSSGLPRGHETPMFDR